MDEGWSAYHDLDLEVGRTLETLTFMYGKMYVGSTFLQVS